MGAVKQRRLEDDEYDEPDPADDRPCGCDGCRRERERQLKAFCAFERMGERLSVPGMRHYRRFGDQYIALDDLSYPIEVPEH